MRQFDPCLPVRFTPSVLCRSQSPPPTNYLHFGGSNISITCSTIPCLENSTITTGSKLPLQNAPFRGKRASETPTFLIFLLLETIGSKYAGRWESSVVLVQSVIQEVSRNSVALVYPTNIRKSHTYISDNMGKYRAEVLSSSSTIIIINIFVFSLARVRAAAAAYMGYLWKQTVQA